MRTPEEVRAYLTEILAHDPCLESHRILERRRAFLHGDPDDPARAEEAATAPVDATEDEVDREDEQAALESIREAFWRLAPGEVEQRIEALRLDDFPDLRAGAARLLRVAALRDRFDELEAHGDVYPAFLGHFQTVVIARPRHAARRREEVEHGLRSAVKRTRAQKTAATLESEFPELYALEPEWLDRILGLEGRRTEVVEQAAKFSVPYFLLFWLLYMAIKSCVHLSG